MGEGTGDLQARLRTLEAALFDASPDVQLLAAVDGTIIARNAAARLLGPSVGLSCLFAAPDAIEALRQRNFLGADQQVLRLKDGRQVLIAAAPVLLEGERYWELVLHDVTTHALVGEDQQVARQLAAVGRLGRLVSNEITSPLTVLLGRIELLQTLGSPPPELLARHLTVMGEHARRIAAVVQDLDALAVRGQGPVAPIPVQCLIGGLLEPLRARLPSLRLTAELDGPELFVSGHDHRLSQVLTTLVVQLSGGLGQGAGLSIGARQEDGEVVIAFQGHASPRFPEARRRLLERWSDDGDAGDLGAAVAVSILVAHGGRLQAAPEPQGLWLALPHRRAAAARETPLRVLFVDDEPVSVALTLDMLASLGHDAVGVDSAEEALDALARAAVDRPFDAVVTDLVLPGLSGLGLREVIAQRWPGLEERVVVVSGARQAPPEAVVFVSKPYTRDQIQRALNGVFGLEPAARA